MHAGYVARFLGTQPIQLGTTILTVDFNNFDVRDLTCSLGLKQVVCSPTRESAVLDLIVTDLHDLYDKPCILAPLGSADHHRLLWAPNKVINTGKSHTKLIKRFVRRYPRSAINAFGR